MKRTCAALAAISLFSFVVQVFAIDVQGTLVDVECHAKDKASKGVSQAAKDCAIANAKQGKQAGLLTDSGEVYLVKGALADNNNARLFRLMGVRVSVQGSVAIDDKGTKTILGGAIKRLDAPPKP